MKGVVFACEPLSPPLSSPSLPAPACSRRAAEPLPDPLRGRRRGGRLAARAQALAVDERDGRAPRCRVLRERGRVGARGTAWSFVPGEVAGVVQFPEVGLPDRMFLSPMTCEAENEFLQAPTRAAQKCQTGTRGQTRTQRYTAVVRKNGRRAGQANAPHRRAGSGLRRVRLVLPADRRRRDGCARGDARARDRRRGRCRVPAFQLVTPLSAYLGASPRSRTRSGGTSPTSTT